MMPLCTTASLSVACGWALFSVGRPCVAQRVWPMPIEPCSGFSCSRASRLRSLPSARRRSQPAVLQRGDAGRIIAAIFEPLQRVDKLARDRALAQNADNAAHDEALRRSRDRTSAASLAESQARAQGHIASNYGSRSQSRRTALSSLRLFLRFFSAAIFSRKARAQPGFSTCRPRATASASAATSSRHHRARADIGAVADRRPARPAPNWSR